jgi:hypothetical protein
MSIDGCWSTSLGSLVAGAVSRDRGFGCDLTTPGRLAPDTADLGDVSGGEPEQPTWLAGNVGGAWRIGGTGHRPAGRWTAAVHALLGLLASRVEHTPRVLGFDEQGREVLTFLPGRVVDIDTELLTPGQIDSLVSWTRRFHEAVAGFGHPGPWRYPRVPQASLIGHNDIAPYNVCFDGDDVAGVFDWDLAGPTTPLMELSFIAWNCVPLWRDMGMRPPRSASSASARRTAAVRRRSWMSCLAGSR